MKKSIGKKAARAAMQCSLAILAVAGMSVAVRADSGVKVYEPTGEPVDIGAAQWKEEYPDQYGSWVDSVMTGTNGPQGNANYNWDEKMGKPVAMTAAIKSQLGVGAACVSCHNTSFVNMFDTYGGDIVNLTEAQLMHEGGDSEGITCYSCHGDTPGQAFVSKTYIMDAVKVGGLDADDVNLVCAQCHALPNRAWEEELGTTKEDRSFGVMGDPDTANWSTLSAGTNADDVYAWFLDHGVKDPKIVIGEMEYEQYHGSSMDRMGVTCATCHMEKVTKEDGTVYTRHAWQGGNINPAIYNNCATCHRMSAEEMQAHVMDIQAAYQERLAIVTAALNEAQAAIEASEADEDTISKASDLWFEARFHSRYGQDSSEGVHGIGNANTEYCFDKCIELCNQIIDMV